jgi:hypothetical protein
MLHTVMALQGSSHKLRAKPTTLVPETVQTYMPYMLALLCRG